MACDDVRTEYDPLAEVPEWFWDRIATAQANPGLFASLTDSELIEFANEMLGLKSYFSHDPFHPPADVYEYVTENTLDEAGALVISQGKEFFVGVWREPRRFWNIMSDHDYEKGSNFEFAAHRAWDVRHSTDIPTI